jgi:hypothetical protein
LTGGAKAQAHGGWLEEWNAINGPGGIHARRCKPSISFLARRQSRPEHGSDWPANEKVADAGFALKIFMQNKQHMTSTPTATRTCDAGFAALFGTGQNIPQRRLQDEHIPQLGLHAKPGRVRSTLR